MRTLYLDCGMGAAGDMLAAALLELLPEGERFLEEINRLDLPGVRVVRERAVKCGVAGTHLSVTVHGEEEEPADAPHTHGHVREQGHPHGSLRRIEQHVQTRLAVPDRVKADILAVYRLIAQAESLVHGVPMTEIHFHEVGTLDALADITMVCLLMDRLAPEQVVTSPIHVGSGQVRCAHGILPVPAPATLRLLQGIPIYGGSIQGELCTPTGAALLKHFSHRFGPLPAMRTEAVGCGCGRKDFEAANCLRALLGETEEAGERAGEEAVFELSCNVDDMTGEALGFAMDRLFEGGALEVYTVPVGMKKSRPGVLLRVICRREDRAGILELLFRHTATLGIRETLTRRYTLARSLSEVSSPWGPVRRKDARGYGVRRSKYEYEDLARIAREQGISLEEVLRALP